MFIKKEKKENLPPGIKKKKGTHFSTNFAYPFKPGVGHVNTFEVVEKHSIIENVGVRFNVETVPKALDEHLKKSNLSSETFVTDLKKKSAEFYAKEFGKGHQKIDDKIRIEKYSKMSQDIVYMSGQGFLDCCLCAFSQHLPLSISPDHIWCLISYAFARHVDENSQALRKNFVNFEGKKRLVVETSGDFKMSQKDKPETGATPEEWEKQIFSSFSKQIKGFIGPKIHKALVQKFSTSTEISQAASEITLMSAMKNYFSFGMMTKCGIPEIKLQGTEEDWINLKKRTEALSQYMTKKFSKKWMPLVLPVLDKFIEAYQGKVNHTFWQTMVKLRHTGGGSGSYSFISGWIQILFPYLTKGLSTQLRPWDKMFFDGPQQDEFPHTISSVPCDWDYLGTKFDLHFHAGFVGFTQDKTDGTLTPEIGWYVTHDPNIPVNSELETVLKGKQKA